MLKIFHLGSSDSIAAKKNIIATALVAARVNLKNLGIII